MKNIETTFKFLIDLKFNNNRNWFLNHKQEYEFAKLIFENFIEKMIHSIKEFDNTIDVNLAKECMYRIYKDARFTKGIEPYKTNFGGVIAKGGRKSDYAGYYLHFEPDNSFIGGGMYKPNPQILKSIRLKILEKPNDFKKIINDVNFKKYFNEIKGEKLKIAPKGFPKDFKDIDLLRFKSYTVFTKVDNDFWFEENVIKNLTEIFKSMYTFNQFLNS